MYAILGPFLISPFKDGARRSCPKRSESRATFWGYPKFWGVSLDAVRQETKATPQYGCLFSLRVPFAGGFRGKAKETNHFGGAPWTRGFQMIQFPTGLELPFDLDARPKSSASSGWKCERLSQGGDEEIVVLCVLPYPAEYETLVLPPQILARQLLRKACGRHLFVGRRLIWAVPHNPRFI